MSVLRLLGPILYIARDSLFAKRLGEEKLLKDTLQLKLQLKDLKYPQIREAVIDKSEIFRLSLVQIKKLVKDRKI